MLGGLIWFIIMIFWIGSKISKAQKDRQNISSETSDDVTNLGSSSPYIAPEDELKRFLMSLSRPPEAPKPSPPQVKQSVTSSRQTRSITRTSTGKTTSFTQKITQKPVISTTYTAPKKQPERQTVIRERPRRKAPVIIGSDAFAHKTPGNTALDILRARIGDDLIKRGSLKKAIVLKEILGEPLALR